MLVATGIFMFNRQEFFGGDAITYDFYGHAQMKAWQGDSFYKVIADRFMNGQASAWGMVNIIALIYSIIGRNTLAIQFVNSVIGAATAVLVFHCAQHVYQNIRVARIAAICVAFFPSLVLWSAQGLKDAPIVFFLVLAILASLRLNEKLSVKHAAILVVALFSILSLRFYVFYMIAVGHRGRIYHRFPEVHAYKLRAAVHRHRFSGRVTYLSRRDSLRDPAIRSFWQFGTIAKKPDLTCRAPDPVSGRKWTCRQRKARSRRFP